MHTFLDLRGAIPTFISLTTGKVHHVNILDILPLEKDAVIAMDRGYVDFTRLYAVNLFPAFFVIRAKSNLRCSRLNSQEVDKTLGLRSANFDIARMVASFASEISRTCAWTNCCKSRLSFSSAML